jgi:heterodisulfide reductase subunit A-like polyferredoxin
MGHIQRPSDQQIPKRIAFLQCIGSRDQRHDYCSAVCCMYATKEALMAKEHHPELDVHVFMMDMRAFSKGYWSYFERARERYGIVYHRQRVSAVQQAPSTLDLRLTYPDETGATRRETFDLVVLSVGMEISPAVRSLGARLGVELDDYGFCHTAQFNPVETSRAGIYAVGPFREPKDIPEAVIEASGAAASAAARLSPARFSLTETPVYPPEREVRGEAPRVGVFVCHCGSNIGGYLDVPQVTGYARSLPGVVHAEDNLYTCSQDSIRHITEQVQALGLNRVVVASCTPLTHQPLFQDSLRAAGLNPYLFEMANIRNQCSWVHSHDPQAATHKARHLVRMAVAQACRLEPQTTLEMTVQPAALVIGAGAAGMTAALSLAEQGFPVHLVEKSGELGGNLRRVVTPLPAPEGCPPSALADPAQTLRRLENAVRAHPAIRLHLNSQATATHGFLGNFTTQVTDSAGGSVEIAHGVTILATGGQEYRGPEYGYGSDPRLLTQLEFEARVLDPGSAAPLPERVAMIQCVGPAEQYCSRICCTVALKNAIALKQRNPAAQVVILYRDIRVYGFKERLYTQARRLGVVFIHYEAERKPQIDLPQGGGDGPLTLRAWEAGINAWVSFPCDLVVLSMPVIPAPGAQALARLFKVPLDRDGFFLEAHVKLRPVDFATDGIFMAGMASYPRLVDETIIQALAASSRAARQLSRKTLTAGGRVAVVDPALCTGCLTCVRICPFNVPRIQPELSGAGGILGAAHIEAAVCQGCGQCAAECPARAIQLMHYTDLQMSAKIGALFEPSLAE